MISMKTCVAVMVAFAIGVVTGYCLDAVRHIAWSVADRLDGGPPYTATFGPPPLPPPDAACPFTIVEGPCEGFKWDDTIPKSEWNWD